MTYQVLIVDDEAPALHLLQMLIEKYAPDFKVVCRCTGAEAALTYLQDNTADVLITDITMPKMNGIELAKAARKQQPDIHIVILSGYAEFEYAQAAIQASVDEYILKPINGSRIKQIMDALRNRLVEEYTAKATALLPALACGLPYEKKDLTRYFASSNYRFAFVRWGGINPRMSQKLRASSLVLPLQDRLFILRGRDEDEQILIFPDEAYAMFLSQVSVYMTKRGNTATWTVIYQPQAYPLVMLDEFINQAIAMLHRTCTLGGHQILPIALPSAGRNTPAIISVSDLNQLQFYCSTGRHNHVREVFDGWAAAMERESVPEEQAYQLVQQIILNLAGTLTVLKTSAESIQNSITDLFVYASSYSELFSSLYSLLFESDSSPRNRKLSTRELYDSAVSYVEQNYAKPLNVQVVCDELGISPTYLSRLFRKYGDTTFNTFLIAQRMDAAIVLLSEKPEMLLRDVAACVGYEDTSYFAKVFYQYTGKKPSKYSAEK